MYNKKVGVGAEIFMERNPVERKKLTNQ